MLPSFRFPMRCGSLLEGLVLLLALAGCNHDDSGERLGDEASAIQDGVKDPSGKDAKFPQVVGVYLNTGGGGREFLCSGTLIDHEVVLFAAHCLGLLPTHKLNGPVPHQFSTFCDPYTYTQPKEPGSFAHAKLTVSFPPEGSADTRPFVNNQFAGIEYGVDGIAWHPDYFKADAVACCKGVAQGCGACDWKVNKPLHGHDLALLHLDRKVEIVDPTKLGFVAMLGSTDAALHKYPINPGLDLPFKVATIAGASWTKFDPPKSDNGIDAARAYGHTLIVPPKTWTAQPSLCDPNDPSKLSSGATVTCATGNCNLSTSCEEHPPFLPQQGVSGVDGDSGGAIVVNYTSLDIAGTKPTGIPALPADKPFLVGVFVRQQGFCVNNFTPTWDFVGQGAMKDDEGHGQFILNHLKDWDNDGVVNDKDNCPLAPNTDQSNCNEDAEVANKYPKRGDLCDPIPCPAVPPEKQAAAKQIPFVKFASLFFWQESGRAIRDLIDLYLISSNYVGNGAHNGRPLGPLPIVEVVPTAYRFCQIDLLNKIDCGPNFVDDALLNNQVEGMGPHKSRPYLRAHVVGTVACGKKKKCPSFSEENLNYYSDGNLTHRRWVYASDYAKWVATKQIDPVQTCDAFGCWTNLNGRFWLNGTTDWATFSKQAGTGYRVKEDGKTADGSHLVNHYFDLAPDATYSAVGAFSVATVPFFLWKTFTDPPPPWWDGLAREDAFLVALPGGGYGLARANGRAISVDAYLGSHLKSMLADSSIVWARAVEPHLTVGAAGAAGGFHALAFAANGTDVIEGVLRQGTMLGTTIDFQRPPTIRPGSPSPRKGFTTVFTRAEDRAFVIGGKALAGGTPLHDVWMRPVDGGGEWSEVALLDFVLGDVLAATWSYRDHRLWLLDERLVKGKMVARLVRVDIYRGVVTLVGEWPKSADFDKQWLFLDRDGIVLLASTSTTHHAIARFVVPPLAAHGTVELSMAIDPRALAFSPFADASGYSLPFMKLVDQDKNEGDGDNNNNNQDDQQKNKDQKDDKKPKDKNENQPKKLEVLSVERCSTLGLKPVSLSTIGKML